MYGIFTYIWAIFGENVGKYSIHGSFGIDGQCCRDHTYAYDWIRHGKGIGLDEIGEYMTVQRTIYGSKFSSSTTPKRWILSNPAMDRVKPTSEDPRYTSSYP